VYDEKVDEILLIGMLVSVDIVLTLQHMEIAIRKVQIKIMDIIFTTVVLPLVEQEENIKIIVNVVNSENGNHTDNMPHYLQMHMIIHLTRMMKNCDIY
jgi:hypothetical protein